MTSADTPYRRGSAAARGWRTFRRWRRGRPFWGSLLTILSALVFFLSGHITLGGMKISFGPQEFLGWVIPLILLLCGVLMLLTPSQRIFYGVLAAAVSVGGLIGLNLGGFFVGMLLGMIGGALGASWTPVQLPPTGARAGEQPGDDSQPDGGARPDDDGQPGGDLLWDADADAGPGEGRPEGEAWRGEGWAGPGGYEPHRPVPDDEGPPPRGPLTDTLPTSMTSPLAVPPPDEDEAPGRGGAGGGPLPWRSPRGLAVILLVMIAATVGLTVARGQTPAAAAPACDAVAAAAPANTGPTAKAPAAAKVPAAGKTTPAAGAAGAPPAVRVASPTASPMPSPTPTGTGAGSGTATAAGPVGVLVTSLLGTIGSLLGGDPTDATPSPTPSDSPSPSPSPSTSPTPSTSPSGTAPATTAPTDPTPTPTRTACPSPTPTPTCPAAQAPIAPADGTTVNEKPSQQITATLSQTLLSYDGVTELKTADGTIRVLEFSMESSTSTPFELRVPVATGLTLVYRSSQLTVSGHVRFYTTKLVGNLEGLLPSTYTPDCPPPLPQGVQVPLVPVVFTDVTLDLVMVRADMLTAPGLRIFYAS